VALQTTKRPHDMCGRFVEPRTRTVSV